MKDLTQNTQLSNAQDTTTVPYSISQRFREFLPVIVDVETAGFDPQKDALLEVAMMTVKFDEKGRLVPDELFSANIRPFEGANINQSNIDFLGIDPFDEKRNLQTESEALIPMFKAKWLFCWFFQDNKLRCDSSSL